MHDKKVQAVQQMEKDDKTTAFQIHKLLTDHGIRISLATILRCRLQLGWTYRGSAYCQLIRHANKEKRLLWCQQNLNEAEDGFENVLWTDESTIQIETHKRHAYRKRAVRLNQNPGIKTPSAPIMFLKLPIMLWSNAPIIFLLCSNYAP